ncbi:MAG: family 20 glycosylhydrolase [Lentisphaeria bacterium]|nr:family 20 glycosylhydrolase [Lentisphaeria bacterium]
MKPLVWNNADTPQEIAAALRELAAEYPFRENGEGRQLVFEPGDRLSVKLTETRAAVTYDTHASALRGAGLALAGVETEGERNSFDLFGIMLDSSRNAVMTVPHAKTMLRRLALMGYTMVMLYTEDTYQLPDEPHFGYLRGAYSLEEVRELDDCAHALGIELIGCIQTLGHLATFLHHRGADPVKDTASVLLAEEDKTYELIRKMLAFWSRACRSRRIHIGMDETHDLGRGKYLDKHGWKRNFDLFNSHLQKVTALCTEAGLRPMIWSDMYFRMGSKKRSYYDFEAVVPEEVKAAIPPEVQLVYWDYYHDDTESYDKMIAMHKSIHGCPVMGSGLWTWYRLIYDHEFSKSRVEPCIDSCIRNGVREFFFTMWGDDGAYCDYRTAYAGLIWGAERAYQSEGNDEDRMEKISAALGCGSWKQIAAASKMNYRVKGKDGAYGTLSLLLWDDPILGIAWRLLLNLDDPENAADFLAVLERQSAGLTELPYARTAGHLLAGKIRLRQALLDAYAKRDAGAMKRIRTEMIPDILERLDAFRREFRRQWLAKYKYNGMETVQIRLGGLAARYQELADRLAELENGTIDSIPELEASSDPRCAPIAHRYSDIVTGGLF